MSPLAQLAPADAEELLHRARAVRLVCFDVDGTLTDGRLIYDSDGRELKAFHARDGQGLVLLRDAGFGIELITARRSAVAELRAQERLAQQRGEDLGTMGHSKVALMRAMTRRRIKSMSSK